MRKKILYLVVLALAFLAASTQTKAHDPWPECGSPQNPCPFVK